ncbi:MAG: ABC transporter substrate-binding protein [Microlunatus sp.]|nr:ABC transporter substrate-binding protein [Microlunatus sp.]
MATACGGGGEQAPATGEGGGQAGGAIVIKGCTPENPLIPGATSETCGGNVIDAFTSKLVHYNTETAAPEMDIAESIESSDNQNFTVKLKPNYKFQDGTDVKAKNFVDAWNYTAYGPNGQAGSYFMATIDGVSDMQCGSDADGAADCEGKPPKSKKASGLKVVDDTTFTIKTSEKVSNLPIRLGYSAFAPLPDSFFDDPKAFEDKPIGSGPFQVDSISNTEMVLSKFADYSGAYKPKVDKMTFRIYQSDEAAYIDVVANNLDYTDNIPPDNRVDEQYKSDLPDRNLVREAGRFASITFSPTDPQIKGNDKLRKALSMAVDRNLIAQQIFGNTVKPADGWVSPVVDGYKPGVCGEWCIYDAAKAKKLYEEAGGYKGILSLTINGDGGHGPWAEAACNSIKNATGADCRVNTLPDFAQFNKYVDSGKWKGMIRSGWQMDYPSIENFLAPLYAKGADSNWSKYDNPDFDAKLAEAAAAKTPEEANTLYQEAEAMLAVDLPTAPMWYPATVVGFSDKVTDVKVNAFGVLDYSAISLK